MLRRYLYDFFTGVVVSFLFVGQLLRLGKKRPLLAKLRVPPLPKLEPVLRIWLHAVSVGEVRAATSLIERFDPSDIQLFVSTATPGGLAIAKQEFPKAAAHFLLPFDFSFHARTLFEKMDPHCLLFCEGDLWPNLLKEAKRRGVATALINGKLSPKSARFFSLAPRFSRRFFSSLDLLCMQSETHKERMAPFVPGKEIHVTGNVKFDRTPPRLDEAALALWKKRLGLREGERVLTIGSTHPGEEELLLYALKEKILPAFQILLVPRHPERGQGLLRSLKELGFACSLLSQGAQERILIVDQMGSLCPCYQVSDLALVAGSFIPGIGGHNLIEPLAYGVPALFGPHVNTQAEMKELVLASQAGFMLEAGDLEGKILSLLAQPEELSAMRARGVLAISSLQGATRKTYELLKPLLGQLKK